MNARRKRALTSSCLGATDASNLNGGVCVHSGPCMRDVFAIDDNNISPRLIMIIKIIILHFIQIRHTDDFPSMSTRLVGIRL